MRLPIVHVAGRAKQCVTGETGSRPRSAATDTMLEGRRQVDVGFVIIGVVLISVYRQWWDGAQPRKRGEHRINNAVV